MRSKLFRMKMALSCGVLCGMLMMTGCKSNASSNTTGNTSSSTLASTEAQSKETMPSKSLKQNTVQQKIEYPSAVAKPVTETSPYGYSMSYDPSFFCMEEAAEADTYTYMTGENLSGPIFISVQLNTDMDVDTLAEGLALQSKSDDVITDEATLGKNSVKGKMVYYTQEVNGITQVHTFYIIHAKQGNLIIEIMGYVGMPEMADAKIEEALGSFQILK